MDKEKLYGFANNKDEKLLVSRLVDVYEGAIRSGYVKASKFLNGREQTIAKNVFSALKADYTFDGGIPDAERKIAICYSDPLFKEIFEVPLKVIDIKLKAPAKLNHRDYLGTLMGLGIKREMFGDILCDENGAKIIVLDEIADYVPKQLFKVGNHGITAVKSDIFDSIFPERKFKEISATVSALRIDSVVATCIAGSRSTAASLIASGNVTVNWEEIVSLSKAVNEKDVISIKGHGRFLVDEIGGFTKKGRTFIKIKKYI